MAHPVWRRTRQRRALGAWLASNSTRCTTRRDAASTTTRRPHHADLGQPRASKRRIAPAKPRCCGRQPGPAAGNSRSAGDRGQCRATGGHRSACLPNGTPRESSSLSAGCASRRRQRSASACSGPTCSIDGEHAGVRRIHPPDSANGPRSRRGQHHRLAGRHQGDPMTFWLRIVASLGCVAPRPPHRRRPIRRAP